MAIFAVIRQQLQSKTFNCCSISRFTPLHDSCEGRRTQAISQLASPVCFRGASPCYLPLRMVGRREEPSAAGNQVMQILRVAGQLETKDVEMQRNKKKNIAESFAGESKDWISSACKWLWMWNWCWQMVYLKVSANRYMIIGKAAFRLFEIIMSYITKACPLTFVKIK